MKINANKKVTTFFWIFMSFIFLGGLAYASTTISENGITTTKNITAQEVCLDDGTCLSNVSRQGYFYNKTSTTYLPNFTSNGLVGYKAGNDICDQEFSGTHVCYESELILSIDQTNISTIDEWTGSAWIITGGAKYSPTDIPVNDCNGFKHGTTGSYLGSFWSFNQTDGGSGAIAHCGNEIAIACCSAGGR